MKRAGWYPAARQLQRWARVAADPTFRHRHRAQRDEYETFAHDYGAMLSERFSSEHNNATVLLVGGGFPAGAKFECGLIKALQAAGATPVVLTTNDPWVVKYYHLAGVRQMLFWEDVAEPLRLREAKRIVDAMTSTDALLAYERERVRVGRFAASSVLRRFRLGSIDFDQPELRQQVTYFLAVAMSAAVSATAILRTCQPSLALFMDRGYTPQGELFDACLARQIPAVTWNSSHKSNALMLKRYTRANRDDHHSSLSDQTWRRITAMRWTPAHRQRLREELLSNYVSGDWYSEVGTQFRTKLLEAPRVRERLGLDPHKKTAVIFSHIFWDATFFWGTDLFQSYEAWFVETVRAACANDRLNWMIKVHPGNIVKNARDGIRSEPSELAALQRQVGPLPSHVTLIPADSDLSTFSLFSVMDYCLTVRGTIGIEAASFGIPVLTAGTGRYDRQGFTIDSVSREEYLQRLAQLHEGAPLSAQQRELAERFAYGIFLLRPLPFTSLTFGYQRDAVATPTTRICVPTPEHWRSAPDLRMFTDWILGSRQEDFLLPEIRG